MLIVPSNYDKTKQNCVTKRIVSFEIVRLFFDANP